MAPTKKLSPDTAKVSTVRLTEGASVSRKVKIVFYKTVLNTCPSFLNEVKNLAKDTGIKDSDLCTQACPYRLARLGTSLRVRGKLTLRKKEFIVLLFINTHFRLFYTGFFAKSHIMFFFHHHSRSAHRSRMTAEVNCVSMWY